MVTMHHVSFQFIHMILLHSADWHLGKRLENHSRLPEQQEFLIEFCAIAEREKPDVILISGDIYDHFQPSNEAAELFYQIISKLSCAGTIPIIVIAGNHDSPDHLQAPDALARQLGIILVGYPRQLGLPYTSSTGYTITFPAPGLVEVTLPDQPPLRIITTPYANALRLRTALDPEHPESSLSELLQSHWHELANSFMDSNGCNVLMAHLFMAQDPTNPEPESDDERSILYVGGIPALSSKIIPHKVQYVALGHLHRPHLIPHPEGIPIVYSGSPLSYSFAEAEQKKQVVKIDIQPGQMAQWQYIPIQSGKPLIRIRTNDADEAIQMLASNQHAFVELTFECAMFLPADIKNRLEAAHPGVFIIPDVSANIPSPVSASQTTRLDNVEDVFNIYFKERTGQEPNKELVELFREILNEQAE